MGATSRRGSIPGGVARLNIALQIFGRAPTILAVLPLVIIWEIAGRLGVSDALPPITQIWNALRTVVEEPQFVRFAQNSITSLAIGFGLALGVGVVVGVAMGLSRYVEESLDLYVNMFMGAPMAAFVPLLVAIFGVGGGSIIATVFLFSLFVIIVNTYVGVRTTDPRFIEMAWSFGATRFAMIRKIVFPSALPLVMTGIRVGFGRAVAGLVLGEMLVVVVGIGGMIMQRGSAFQVAQLWALIFIVVTFSVTATRLLERLQDKLTGWAST